MTSPVSSASTAASALAATSSASSASSSSTAAAKAKLNQLIAQYRANISKGESASDLKRLASQIQAAAKAAGQNNVNLPQANTSSAASSASESTSASDTAPASQGGIDFKV